MSFYVKYTQTKNDVIYVQSFDNAYFALTLLFHLILTCMSWLQPRKGDLHFILSDNDNYDFDIKVGRYGFVSFINDVIDRGCLGYVLQFNNYIRYVCVIYNCCFYDKFITNKIL